MYTHTTETENKTASHTPIKIRPTAFGSDLFGSLLNGLFDKLGKCACYDDAPSADTPPAVAARPDAKHPPQNARTRRTADDGAPDDKDDETDDRYDALTLGGEAPCNDMPDRAPRTDGDTPCSGSNAVPEPDAAMAAWLALPSPDTAAGDGAGSRPCFTPVLPNTAAATALAHSHAQVPLQALKAPRDAPPGHAHGHPGGPKVTVTPPAPPPTPPMLAPATAAAALQLQTADAGDALEAAIKLPISSIATPPVAVTPATATQAAIVPAAAVTAALTPGQADDGAGFDLGSDGAGNPFIAGGNAVSAAAANSLQPLSGESDEFGALLSAKFAPTTAAGGLAGLAGGTPAARAAAHAPVQSAPALPREAALDQIAVHVRKAVADGLDQISIRLKPAELGHIDIHLDIAADGRVVAHVIADRAETLELLQRDARGLERTLQDSGLRADAGALNFGLRGDGNANANGREAAQAGRALATGIETADPITPMLPAARVVADGRIDLHV